MKLQDIKTITDIKAGDHLLITGDGLVNKSVTVKKVKVSEVDGTEIIFDLKNNRYFNLGMFLQGKSWVKDLAKVI